MALVKPADFMVLRVTQKKPEYVMIQRALTNHQRQEQLDEIGRNQMACIIASIESRVLRELERRGGRFASVSR